MNKKGFTLVELLAVIAILAILAIIAVPNILKLFNTSKKNIFLLEARTLYSEAIKKYSLELATSDGLDIISSNGDNKLSLNGENIDYCILFNSEGKITSLKATNGKYYVEYTESGIDGLTVEKVIEGTIDLSDCEGSNTNVGVPTISACAYEGELVNGLEIRDNLYTYRYMQEYIYDSEVNNYYWEYINNGDYGWGAVLTDKSSTQSIDTPPCNSINGKPIVSMSHMFYNSKATSIDLSSFDTSYVTNMSGMFNGSKANTINLNNLRTGSVTDMSYMFKNSEVTELDLSGFNVSQVINMKGMFESTNLDTIDIRFWNSQEGNITDISYMFYKTKAREIFFGYFDTRNVTDMSYMFANSSIESISVLEWNMESLENDENMFLNAYNLVGCYGTEYDPEIVDSSYARIDQLNGEPGYFTMLPFA